MSRIDDALKRGGEAAPGPTGNEGGVRSDADAAGLETPWAIDEEAAAPAPDERVRVVSAPLGPPASQELPGGEPSVVDRFTGVQAEKIVGASRVAPAFAEQYRKLAATLHHAQRDRGIKSVLVASAMAGEGKTLTATNLALTLSESYMRRVLLIDADLRRPSLHHVFQAPNASGLSDGLRDHAERKLTLSQISPMLTLLTAGKPDADPMSSLSSARMRQVIEDAVEAFDWVLIDTPPVGLLPDANLLAAMVDAAVLVVHAGRTPTADLQKAIGLLGRDRVLGVVLNRVGRSNHRRGYGYGEGYGYGYGY